MELKLGETAYFDFTTHTSTGEVADASVVGCEIFEDSNDTPILTPTPVKRTGKTGNYRVQVDGTIANGFEVDKPYNVIASATTDKAGKGCIGTFKVRANHIGELALDSTVAKEDTLNSLSTKFSGMSSIPNWLRGLYRKDVMDTSAKSEININGGSFNETTDSVQAIADAGALIQSRVNNMSGTSRIQTTLTDIVQAPSGDNWIKVEVLVNDEAGNLFDPADLTDPAYGSRQYNGIGAEFTDWNNNRIQMYKDSSSTLLDSVSLCHHIPQSNKPQILVRDAHGLYNFWMNATATGNALPLGQLQMLVGMFDVEQTIATYDTSSPYLIQDTSNHFHSIFAVNVVENLGIQGLVDQVTGLGNPMQAGTKVQLNVSQPDYPPLKSYDYIVPDNSSITLIKTKTDSISWPDVTSRLASADYIVPDNSSIALIKTKTDTINWVDIDRLLGLTLENSVEDDIIRDSDGNKTNSIIYLYNSKINADIHNKITGIVNTYNVMATYTDKRLSLFRMTLV